MIYNRHTKEYIEEKDSSGLKFLYSNVVGRFILKVLTMKWFTNVGAMYMRSSLSKFRIKRFIKKNNINMDDYINEDFKCFDEFFIRKIKDDKRPLSDDKALLLSPCDAKLSVYKIDDNTVLNIKNSSYTVSELLQDESLASTYKDGYCLVFRLCVDDYHRYYYIDDGINLNTKKINGVLHTVRPIALKYRKVFSENSREYSLLKTNNFGNVVEMEVGALLVGKICNLEKKEFKRGEEKGYFRFGGSTIVLLFEKDRIILDEDILDKVNQDIEIKVNLFDVIGRRD